MLRPLFDHAPDLKADEIAIIGDSPNDIQTAVNAGLGLSIGVLTGVGQEHELQHADYVVQSAPEAVEILEKKNGREA